MARGLREFERAVSLLTIIPVDAEWPEAGCPDTPGWFPLVGLIVGLAQWVLALLWMWSGLAGSLGLLAALSLVVASWVFTRGMHWDGLADVTDAWWGGATPERRLEIMKDTNVGAFGTAAVSFAAIWAVVASAPLLERGELMPFLVVPAVARMAASFAAWFGTPARASGLGHAVMGRTSLSSFMWASLAEIICWFLGYLAWGWWGLGFVIAGEFVALVVPHLIAGRMGGVTGDVMGASVLLTELALYALAAVLVVTVL